MTPSEPQLFLSLTSLSDAVLYTPCPPPLVQQAFFPAFTCPMLGCSASLWSACLPQWQTLSTAALNLACPYVHALPGPRFCCVYRLPWSAGSQGSTYKMYSRLWGLVQSHADAGAVVKHFFVKAFASTKASKPSSCYPSQLPLLSACSAELPLEDLSWRLT